MQKTDFLIIGGGLAGLFLALKLAPHGEVIILVKTKINEGNSLLAQGGIAAVVSEGDSLEQHIADTLEAGAGLCTPQVVEATVAQGPDRIRELIQFGVKFASDENSHFFLNREGGHSQRRILHVEDTTGSAIHEQLLKQARAHQNIHIIEEQLAVDLITSKNADERSFAPNRCLGAYVLDKKSGQVNVFLGRSVALATGGAGKVYLYTSNWSGATGDGIAMAYRAGCRLGNLGFM